MRVTKNALLVLLLALLGAVVAISAIGVADQSGALMAADAEATATETVVTADSDEEVADDEVEDEDEDEVVEEDEDTADDEEVDREALFLESVTRARTDGLLAWWGPSAQTVDELTAENGNELETARAFSEAANRLHDEGADIHDLSAARFAAVELSAGASAQVSAQLELQAERRAEAAERRTLASVGVSGVEVCRAIVTAVRRYRAANARGGAAAVPHMEEVLSTVRAEVAGATEEDVAKVWPIVLYRVLFRGTTTEAACNVNALGLGLRASARTSVPVGGTIKDFAMGLEEEYSDVRMNPDSENVAGLAVSGNVPAPRMAPYIKICPDHTMAPPGYPSGKAYGVIEVATGPLPIGWEARDAHRRVTARWRAALPPAPTVLKEGMPTSLARLTRAFNDRLPVDLQPYEMPIEKLRHDHDDFEITDYPNANMPINSIQTNFEASLCSVYDNAKFLALHVDESQSEMLIAARKAATAYVSGPDGAGRMAGVRKAEVDALPAQQRCELHGLFTVAFLHAMYWGTQASSKLGMPENAYVPIHPNGGTPKNFFSVMIKTNLRDVVDRLPFPMSDIVHTFYESSLQAGRPGVRAAMHHALTTALKASTNPLMRVYAGPVINLRARGADRGRPLSPLRPWLAANGEYMDSVVRAMGTRPFYNPTSCSPIGDRAPPASVYRNPRVAADANGEYQQQVVVVCEARFQTEPLNRAMTEGGVEPRQLPRGRDKVEYAKSLIADLLAATSTYKPDGGKQIWRAGEVHRSPSLPSSSTITPAIAPSSSTTPPSTSATSSSSTTSSTRVPATGERVPAQVVSSL